MGRLVILLLLAVVVGWWLFGRAARLRQGTGPAADKRKQKPDAVQDMVACAHCGVHLPRNEALAEGELSYCSDAHRRLGPGG